MTLSSDQSFVVHGAGSSGSAGGDPDGLGFGGESLARHPAGEGPEQQQRGGDHGASCDVSRPASRKEKLPSRPTTT